jgi:hypothetical protein
MMATIHITSHLFSPPTKIVWYDDHPLYFFIGCLISTFYCRPGGGALPSPAPLLLPVSTFHIRQLQQVVCGVGVKKQYSPTTTMMMTTMTTSLPTRQAKPPQ